MPGLQYFDMNYPCPGCGKPHSFNEPDWATCKSEEWADRWYCSLQCFEEHKEKMNIMEKDMKDVVKRLQEEIEKQEKEDELAQLRKALLSTTTRLQLLLEGGSVGDEWRVITRAREALGITADDGMVQEATSKLCQLVGEAYSTPTSDIFNSKHFVDEIYKALEPLTKYACDAQEALIWSSAAPSFMEGGIAREGFEKIRHLLHEKL